MIKIKEEKQPEGQMNVPAKDLPIPKHPKDWRHSFHWRVMRIQSEFIDGFQFLADFDKTITFFGSARCGKDSHWYKEAKKLGKILAENRFTVITGGGPGIMEAGNEGAVEGNGESVGLNIQLPMEQRTNPFVRKSAGFHYFFVRKVMLSFSAQAYVFFPGGYGTLDEFFELLNLIQTHKIYEKIPLILVGKDFWGHVDDWFRTKLLNEYKTIDEEDIKLYSIVNTAEEAFEIVKNSKPREEFKEMR